jgi:DNA-binding protein H-NS
VEYANLSLDEIREQLEQIEQNRADLEKALDQRRQQAKYDLAQQLKDTIVEHGYDVAEIARLLSGRKRRGVAAGSKKGARRYTKYVDPENADNVYVRGVIPGWMKDKMQEQGYDPGSKADREAFKSSYLHAVD